MNYKFKDLELTAHCTSYQEVAFEIRTYLEHNSIYYCVPFMALKGDMKVVWREAAIRSPLVEALYGSRKHTHV